LVTHLCNGVGDVVLALVSVALLRQEHEEVVLDLSAEDLLGYNTKLNRSITQNL